MDPDPKHKLKINSYPISKFMRIPALGRCAPENTENFPQTFNKAFYMAFSVHTTCIQ